MPSAEYMARPALRCARVVTVRNATCDGMVIYANDSFAHVFADASGAESGRCLRFAEIFAGGFGGWHRELQTLSGEVPARVVWSLERDAKAMEVYALSFWASVIDKETQRPHASGAS